MTPFARICSIILTVCAALSLILCVIVLVKKPAEDGRKNGTPFLALKTPPLAKGPGIAVIYIYGPIGISGSSSPWNTGNTGSDDILTQLSEIKKNRNIKGIVLRIDSPGGTIGSVQEICQKLQEMKKSGIRVVASLADIAASGGYYIACQADSIVANPGTLTGSIGVIMSSLNWSELLKKAGIRPETIKSGEHKDILSPFRDMSPQERRLLQDVVDDSYGQFLQTVARNRKISLSRLKNMADGRIFTGRQALKLDLVDELGNFDSAIRTAGRLCGLGESPVIYPIPRNPWDMIRNELNVVFQNRLTRSLFGNYVPIQYSSAP